MADGCGTHPAPTITTWGTLRVRPSPPFPVGSTLDMSINLVSRKEAPVGGVVQGRGLSRGTRSRSVCWVLVVRLWS